MGPDEIEEVLTGLALRTEPPYEICIPVGWWGLLAQLVTRLNALSGAWRLLQAQERDGVLHLAILCEVFGHEMNQIVEQVERASSHTCRTCGGPGKLYRQEPGWVTTCPAHRTAA